VIRINRDGSIPEDNPWLNCATVLPETFAHGFRDPEGAAINPVTGELWATGHGQQRGDEINIVRAGKDYGWRAVSYGVQYDQQRTDEQKNVPAENGRRRMEGVEEPFVGSLAGTDLVRLPTRRFTFSRATGSCA
jgi:glucose/arabinose dehydrogenase